MGIDGILGNGQPVVSPWGYLEDAPAVAAKVAAAATNVLEDSTMYEDITSMEPWSFWDQVARDYHSPPECRTNCAAAAVGGDAPSVPSLRDADGDVVPSLACCAFGVPARCEGDFAFSPDTDVTEIPDPKHRVKVAPRRFPFNALVARPVRKDEIAKSPDAQKAMNAEWDRLLKAEVWGTKCREWDDVAAEALRDKKEVQFGYLFDICVEKGSELPLGSDGRKFKGRVVFQGNRVVNQSWEAAVFQDLGNSPATMDASRAADCFGCFPGHKTEIAEAVQAYIQARLKGNRCWICLPPDRRPPGAAGMRKPVVELFPALYGHPDSGSFWEEH